MSIFTHNKEGLGNGRYLKSESPEASVSLLKTGAKPKQL